MIWVFKDGELIEKGYTDEYVIVEINNEKSVQTQSKDEKNLDDFIYKMKD